MAAGRRYGPPPEEDERKKEQFPDRGNRLDRDFLNDEKQKEWENEDAKRLRLLTEQFEQLLSSLVEVPQDQPEKLASIMSQNGVDVLLNLRGYEGVQLFQSSIDKAMETGDDAYVARVTSTCDYMINFVEEFVTQAQTMDEFHKGLLGQIMKSISGDVSDRLKEERLEKAMGDVMDKITPGFLRHVENECARLRGMKSISPETGKLLQTMQVLQTRLVEELGKDLGEGALVLGQLVGYDNRDERLAVLEAGLTVRGKDFAKELASLTGEALDGFRNVPGGADPELVMRVTEIDDKVNAYMDARP